MLVALLTDCKLFYVLQKELIDLCMDFQGRQLLWETVLGFEGNQEDIEECHQFFTTFFGQEISLEFDEEGDHQESDIIVSR
jgi:hypothetical protein